MLFVFFSTKSGTNFETRALAISVGETTPYLSLTSALVLGPLGLGIPRKKSAWKNFFFDFLSCFNLSIKSRFRFIPNRRLTPWTGRGPCLMTPATGRAASGLYGQVLFFHSISVFVGSPTNGIVFASLVGLPRLDLHQTTQ